LDTYIEAQKEFPRELLDLDLAKGVAKPFKTDYLKKEVWYSLEGSGTAVFNLTIQQVKDIIQQNKRGIRPEINSVAESNKEENKMEVKLDGNIDRFSTNKKGINKKRRSKFKPKTQKKGKFVVNKNLN
jgi:hypothetical protein